jgi:hypothetical protein
MNGTAGNPRNSRRGGRQVEGIRWHDGVVWFSDLTHNKIRRVGLDRTAPEVAHVPGTPIELSWPNRMPLACRVPTTRGFQVAANGSVSEYARLS